MSFEKLNKRVIKWAKEKGILDKATPLTQIAKTQEELDETKESLFAQANNLKHFINSKSEYVNTEDQIKDDFGDQLVTILIGCKLQEIDPLECLEIALNIIEKRTGKMVKGTFIKDNK